VRFRIGSLFIGTASTSLTPLLGNPKGSIRDTVLQRVIMNSLSDGALRLYAGEDQMLLHHGVTMMSEYYHAVQHVFADDRTGKTPKTSRLVHGTGIIALDYVMDFLNSTTGAVSRDEFARGLQLLKGKTAWSDGKWEFGSERRRWNGLQNVPSDVRQLTLYLVQVLKRGLAKNSKAA